MDFSVSLMYQPGAISWIFYEEIARAVAYGLADLGHRVEMAYGFIPEGRPAIIFGIHDVPEYPLNAIPAGSAIYNLEQIVEGSRGLDPDYLDKMRAVAVWDYSARNVENLKTMLGIEARHVPLGYAPVLDRIRRDIPQDIDVLFYGWLNERRQKVVDDLRARGLNVMASQNLFGSERDFMIARSKVILNMHFYTPGIMEVVRIHDLLANHKAVVCECGADTEVHAGFEDTCVFAPYEGLADAVHALVSNDEARAIQENKGFSAFAAMPYAGVLERIVGRGDGPGGVFRKAPRSISFMPGGTFRPECLNISGEARFNMDIPLDEATGLPACGTAKTTRFGDICLQPGSFRHILAEDVLERIGDVPGFMSACLDLLEEGGRLDIAVPFSLSAKAWSHPRHKRAFTEETLRLFLEEPWNAGWENFRFRVERTEYKLSRIGRRLRRFLFLKPDSLLLRCVPRAVEAIRYSLIKVPTSVEERLQYLRANQKFYKTNAFEVSSELPSESGDAPSSASADTGRSEGV